MSTIQDGGDLDVTEIQDSTAHEEWSTSNEDSDYSSDDDEELSDYELSDAQVQWEESLRQLQTIWQFVLIPIVGKFLGRRFSFYCKDHFVLTMPVTLTNQYGESI